MYECLDFSKRLVEVFESLTSLPYHSPDAVLLQNLQALPYELDTGIVVVDLFVCSNDALFDLLIPNHLPLCGAALRNVINQTGKRVNNYASLLIIKIYLMQKYIT